MMDRSMNQIEFFMFNSALVIYSLSSLGFFYFGFHRFYSHIHTRYICIGFLNHHH